MKLLKNILIGMLVFSGNTAAFAKNEACDSWFEPKLKPIALVLLTHGMNLKPERMDQLGEVLRDAGYLVLRPGFTGHCGPNNENYLKVTSEEWRADAERVYGLASAKAKTLNIPLELVAYSFTTLIYQEMSEQLPFTKKVFLAPALDTHWWYPFVNFTAKLFPWIAYDSKNIPDYAMNKRSGARAFLAMNSFMGSWKDGRGAKDQAPSLWIVDPQDELISFSGLQKLCPARPGCELFPISNSGSTLPKTYHHLIIDKDSLGNAEWTRMTAEILRFLKP